MGWFMFTLFRTSILWSRKAALIVHINEEIFAGFWISAAFEKQAMKRCISSTMPMFPPVRRYCDHLELRSEVESIWRTKQAQNVARFSLADLSLFPMSRMAVGPYSMIHFSSSSWPVFWYLLWFQQWDASSWVFILGNVMTGVLQDNYRTQV